MFMGCLFFHFSLVVSLESRDIRGEEGGLRDGRDVATKTLSTFTDKMAIFDKLDCCNYNCNNCRAQYLSCLYERCLCVSVCDTKITDKAAVYDKLGVSTGCIESSMVIKSPGSKHNHFTSTTCAITPYYMLISQWTTGLSETIAECLLCEKKNLCSPHNHTHFCWHIM